MPSDRTWEIVVRACWLGRPAPDVSDAELAAAIRFARRNEVEADFVRRYASRLPEDLARIEETVTAYRRTLLEACARLGDAGVAPILIKALPEDDYTYSNFDIVVGDDGWDSAVAALDAWAESTSRHPLERGTKMLLYPPEGPAVHLHREVAWFDVPAVPTDRLRNEATPAAGIRCLSPSPADALEILVAHAVFQNLAFSLGELIAYRDLASDGVEREAAARARADGWARGFRSAARLAHGTMRRLDRLDPTRLPAPFPIAPSLVGGVEHALHLARTRRLAGSVRELALRAPLVAAKRRAVYR